MAAAQARQIADKLERQRIMEMEAENARQRLEQKTKGRKEERRLSELVDAQKAKVSCLLFFLFFIFWFLVFICVLIYLFIFSLYLIPILFLFAFLFLF